jgi:type I restriction enzyme R subunit
VEKADITFFDPQTDWTMVERALPHWAQSGCVCFVTWRLHDSLPKQALEQIDLELAALLSNEGFDPCGDWKYQLAQQAPQRRSELQWKLFKTRDKYLNKGYGDCHLLDSRCSAIIIDSLKKFDKDRYFLTDVVVMPNHVHFLCAFADATKFLKQCTEWKRYTGRQINRLLERVGEFWQVDQFDHLIRSPEQFEYYRRYIQENPSEANLAKGSYQHFQKQLT